MLYYIITQYNNNGVFDWSQQIMHSCISILIIIWSRNYNFCYTKLR